MLNFRAVLLARLGASMGVHVTWGAFSINAAAAVSALLFSLIWLFAWRRMRYAYTLLLAGGWLGLCVYWGLLAVSAGPAPVIERTNIVVPVRATLLVSMALLLAGKLALLVLACRLQRCMSGGANR
jgi:hypothetical protein